MGRTTAGAILKQMLAIAALFLGILFDSWQWDNRIMQSPDELTVTEFERAECGLSVVLTNAIEDQRALVKYMAGEHDRLGELWFEQVSDQEKEGLADQVKVAAELQFRAMRVLGLLEATREREAGQVT